MAPSKSPVVCNDDHGIVPSHVEHAPAFLLNPDADPLVLFSAAHARIVRMRQALEPYIMLADVSENSLPDATSLHQFLMALYHQTQEACQIIEAGVDRLATAA